MSQELLPAPSPTVSPESSPFWLAASRGQVLLQRCPGCGAVTWYPRGTCPDCWNDALEWFEASGRGSIYSFTVNRRGTGPYRDLGGYVLAYVELEDGPRVLTNIVDCDLAGLRIGLPVRAVHHRTGDHAALLRFRPA